MSGQKSVVHNARGKLCVYAPNEFSPNGNGIQKQQQNENEMKAATCFQHVAAFCNMLLIALRVFGESHRQKCLSIYIFVAVYKLIALNSPSLK
jgi:hypothetical protein